MRGAVVGYAVLNVLYAKQVTSRKFCSGSHLLRLISDSHPIAKARGITARSIIVIPTKERGENPEPVIYGAPDDRKK